MGSFATRLFALPTHLSGVARTLDIGGTFNGFNFSRTGPEADVAALAADWQAVGADLRDAAEAWAEDQGVRR